MNRSPYISILSATLNNIDTIERALESVRRQCFKSFEHVVVDGGSRDGTLEVIGQYENKYNLKWISGPDRGIAHALNKGLRLARGRYILVIHGDDRILEHNTLEIVYQKLKEENSDIYSFPVLKEHPEVVIRPYKPIRLLWWHHFKTIFPHQGCFVHKRLFDRIGGFREKFSIALDYDFFYRALHSGASVRFGRKPVALMGGGGISSDLNLIRCRLLEERKVQQLNEAHRIWRIFQVFFHLIYDPYKLYLFPRISVVRRGKQK